MRAKPTPFEVEAEFRAHYLYSGNASESARKVGIPDRTGRDLARRLIGDESFANARREIRASALEELTAMRMRVAAKALERFEEEVKAPEVPEGSSVTIIDKRPDYGKLVLESEKNAIAGFARSEPEQQRQPVEVHIHGPASVAASEP